MNKNLLAIANQNLALAQHEYETTLAVLAFADAQGVALTRAYSVGYCAAASAEINLAELSVSLKELIFSKFKPLPVVHLFSTGNYSTVKPLACVTQRELTSHNIVPAFPVYQKTSGKESTLRWWTKADDLVVEVYLNATAISASEFSQLVAEWGVVTPEAITYAQGSTAVSLVALAPVHAKELPLMQLQAELSKFDSAWLSVAWAWRIKGVAATQQALDAIVKSDATKNYRLAPEKQAEILSVQTEIAQRYLPLALETDTLLNQCADALEALFEEKGVPELTPTGITYLKHYLARTLGITVPSIALKHLTGSYFKVELGLASRPWFAPLEKTIQVHNAATLRLQDIPVTYASIASL